MDSNDYRLLRNSIDSVGEVQENLGILIAFIVDIVENDELDIFGLTILCDTHKCLLEITQQVRENRQQLMEAARNKVKKNCDLELVDDE